MVLRKFTEKPFLELKNSYDKGQAAEAKVRKYFEERGYFCLGQRVDTPYFEVDLILENENVIYLVEVKTISDWSRVQNRVTLSQKKKLLKARLYVLAKQEKPVLCLLVFIDHKDQIWSTELTE